MTAFLYFSISSDLTKDEILKIDEEVSKNRELVSIFIKNLPCNIKHKSKRICYYGIFLFTISQPIASCVSEMFQPEIPRMERCYNTIQYDTDPGLINLVSTQVRTKSSSGESSIFVKAFQLLVPSLKKSIKVYDSKEGVEIRPLVMMKAYGNCNEENNKLPREITNDDKSVKFNHKKRKYKDLFKKNYEVFNFDVNLYIDNNLSKSASDEEIDKAKDKLFREYGERSKEFLRVKLFRNPCIIKLLNCKFETDPISVTIYFDQLTDLFAIVDKKNVLVDFGVATELTFAEIFAYKEKDTALAAQRCILPPEAKEFSWDKKKDDSKALSKLEDQNIISYDDALAIVRDRYEWQLVKKIEHAACFKINFMDYGFTNKQAVEINQGKDGLVGYVQRLERLLSKALMYAYLDSIKQFCEDRSVKRDNDAIFRSKPAIIFWKEDQETDQMEKNKYITFVIFDPDTKRYVSSYKMKSDSPQAIEYKSSKVLGVVKKL